MTGDPVKFKFFSVQQIDPASIEGKTMSFIGAFSLDDIENIIVVPVQLEVTD